MRAYVKIGSTVKRSSWRYSSYITVNRKPGEVEDFTAPGPGVQDKTSFSVTWDAVTGVFDKVTKYQLQCSINGQPFSSSGCGNDDLGTKTTMTVSLPEGAKGEYRFRAKACNSQGCYRNWTRPAYQKVVTVDIPLTNPDAISFVGFEEEGRLDRNGVFTLNWNPSSSSPEITGYQVEQCRGEGANCASTSGNWSRVYSEADDSTRSVALPSAGGRLTSGKYQYRVRSYVELGDSPTYSEWLYSAIVTVNRKPDEVASFIAPESLEQTEGFSVTWAGVSGAFDKVTKYQLQCSIEGGPFNFSNCSSSDSVRNLGTETSARISPSEGSEGQYRFRVRACNSEGCGSWTASGNQKSVYVDIPYSAPKPPYFVNLPEDTETGDYDVRWKMPNSPGEYTAFELKRRCKMGAESCGHDGWGAAIPLADALDTTFPARGDNEDRFQYQVRACNKDECSSWRTSAWVDVHNLNGIRSVVPLATATKPGNTTYKVEVTQQGDAVINIPVKVAPGVNGLSPDVGINYSGARYLERSTQVLPEDTLGYGWRLSGFGEIRRCVVDRPNTDSIQLDYTDSVCLDGEPLELISGATPWAPGALLRTKRDDFSLIKVMSEPTSHKWFKVLTPDGRVMEYGNTEGSRVRVGSSTPFAWSLNKVTDTFGNSIEYKYHRDTVEGINYPLEIIYGNDGDARVTFEYSTRTDAPPQPLGPDGIQQEQLVLLHHINVYLDDNPIREYRLISEDEGEVADYRRLEAVQLCGYDKFGSTSDCLNQLEFEWDTDTGVDVDTGIYQITDGLGKITEFDLTPVDGSQSPALLGEDERPFGDGIVPYNASPMVVENGSYRWVVTELRHSNGESGGWNRTTYAYQGSGFVSDYNRGFLGYYAQKIHDQESDIVTYRQFRLDFPHYGRVARVYRYKGSYPNYEQVLSKRQYHYEDISLSSGDGSTHYPVMKQSLETLYEQDQVLGYRLTENIYSPESYGAESGDLIAGIAQTVKIATAADVSTEQGFWGEVKPASVSGVQRSTETVTSYLNRTGAWLIGFVSGKAISHFDGDIEGSADSVQTMTAHPWPGSNKPASITRFPGNPDNELEVAYEYDGQGNLLKETTSGANIETRETLASGYETLEGDRRYPTTLTNAEGQTMQISYDSRFGSENKITDADGRDTRVSYDAFGREISRTNDTDNVTFTTTYSFCYAGICPDNQGQLAAYKVSTTSSPKITPDTETYYDLMGRPVREDTESFDGSGFIRREYSYDAQGRLREETAPFIAGEDYRPLTVYHYDLRNRVAKVVRPDGSELRTTYSVPSGTRKVKMRIEEDVLSSEGVLQDTLVKEKFYALTGDLVKAVDAQGTDDEVITEYTYYGSGLLHKVKVNGDTSTESEFSYDDAGNRDSLVSPSVGTVISMHDALGQLIGQTDNKNQNITYQYDKLGRLVEQVDADGAAEWEYDPPNATGSIDNCIYTKNGVEVFSETYSYDDDGKLQTTDTRLVAGGLTKSYSHSYGYDAQGRLDRVTYPDTANGVEAHYEYNTQGYLEKITDGVNPYKTFEDLNAFGQVKEEIYGNGVITNRTYNANTGRLESISTGVDSGNGLQNNEYYWRSNGTLESRLVYSNGNTQEEKFTYDSLSRLTRAKTWLNNSLQRTLTTEYNKLGNILEKTSTHSSDTDVDGYQYGEFGNAGPNAVSNVNIGGTAHSLHYDQNGAITRYDAVSGDDKWVTWSARKLPIEIVVGTSKTTQTPTARDRFKYGPNGQRYYRETSWWDEEKQKLQTEKAFIIGSYEELLPANDPDYQSIEKVRIDRNIVHIAATDYAGITVDTVEYLHRDHLGSIEKITDESGNLLVGAVGELAFDPYGTRKKADWSSALEESDLEELLEGAGLSTRRGFTGHEHLDRTGLIHMNGRIYDPTLGRFLSPDPIVQAPTYSQNWNRYSYVVNNPLSFTDPSGYKVHNGCKTRWTYNHSLNMLESSTRCGGGGRSIHYPKPRDNHDRDHDIDDLPGLPVPVNPVSGGGQGGDTEKAKEKANSWGDGKDDSDLRWSVGLQGGAKFGVKGIFGGAVGIQIPLIETSLVTGNRYASEEYAFVIDIGKWSFGYEAKRSIPVGKNEVMAGKALRGTPFEGGFKFGSYGVSSSELGVFSIGLKAIIGVDAKFDFSDGIDW
ncbi:RHS repeat domain-containing protein [Microbulbifer halophilus]|uniref:RHS repeat domain-containing protein n=1 Tax=Microbulbifer halophilus TaxID=453963 RepID=A0ABW5E9F1_9GAMM|nr:RHS repeat-associated core domain-containing protein [Microbulbifer halophilus]MCW8126446.1 hypothetical protein [Microbulbifer halophilus]